MPLHLLSQIVDLDAVARLDGTGRLQASIDLDHAHPATAMRIEFPVIAQMRNIDAGLFGSLDDALAGFEFDVLSIHHKAWHISYLLSGPG